MMKYILPPLLLILSAHAYAQYRPLRFSKDSVGHISKEAILADLDEYANGIRKRHVDAFTIVKKSTFFAAIQALKDSADQYDTDELLIHWLKVNAMIGGEHTNVLYNGGEQFPLRCYWFSEGIYITATDVINTRSLHAQVIAVNGFSVDEVAERIKWLCSDTNGTAVKQSVCRYLFDPFVIHGLGMAPSRKAITYTIINDAGDTIRISPIAHDWRHIKFQGAYERTELMRFSRRDPYWFTYIAERKYIYFRFSKFYDDKKFPFASVQKRLLRAIDSIHPDKLIIDLRDNGGGRISMLNPFIEQLGRSFLNRKGHIYVLIGRRTFSAAILATAELKRRTYAITVGEETSGSVAHFTHVDYFKLPHTNLRVSYSNAFVAIGERYEGSLRPDVIIPETFANYAKGIDAAIEYTIGQ